MNAETKTMLDNELTRNVLPWRMVSSRVVEASSRHLRERSPQLPCRHCASGCRLAKASQWTEYESATYFWWEPSNNHKAEPTSTWVLLLDSFPINLLSAAKRPLQTFELTPTTMIDIGADDASSSLWEGKKRMRLNRKRAYACLTSLMSEGEPFRKMIRSE